MKIFSIHFHYFHYIKNNYYLYIYICLYFFNYQNFNHNIQDLNGINIRFILNHKLNIYYYYILKINVYIYNYLNFLFNTIIFY